MGSFFVCLFLFFFFFFGCTMWHVELPWPGIEPTPPAVEAQSLNHWTTWEALMGSFYNKQVDENGTEQKEFTSVIASQRPCSIPVLPKYGSPNAIYVLNVHSNILNWGGPTGKQCHRKHGGGQVVEENSHSLNHLNMRSFPDFLFYTCFMLKYFTYLSILQHGEFWYMQDNVKNNIYDFEEHFRKYFGTIMQRISYRLCLFISNRGFLNLKTPNTN